MAVVPQVDLRQMRTFAAVAERRSFSRAADDLHIAQQAVSQQIAALERALGVTLLHRNARMVELTPEGTVFLADARRAISAADRAIRRVQAAARGEAGTVRLAYTLTTAFETIPEVLGRLARSYPDLKVVSREVFGGDISELLTAERYDLALAPATPYAREFAHETVRRESLVLAVAEDDPLAGAETVSLSTLGGRGFETWPREMAPGFHDTLVATCRAAGFVPRLDEQATGSAVWGYIARGRGIGLINHSVIRQLPRGVVLRPLDDDIEATLTFEAVWHRDAVTAPLMRVLDEIRQLSRERRWLTRGTARERAPA